MAHSVLRISKELVDIQKGADLGFDVACLDSNISRVSAVIIGPHETPYEFGFFEFIFLFPQEYPSKAPTVYCRTTNRGQCRFNPNIYASGKVCLSILGTWPGERGEQWSSAQGLESIILSIQSLLSQRPYENEPGYQNARSSLDQQRQREYNLKIRHETLRIAVIAQLEYFLGLNPDGSFRLKETAHSAEEGHVFETFKDLYKRRFLWYYQSYLAAVEQGKLEVNEQQSFARMPFEMPGMNIMDGKFNYPQLERRLKRIKLVLDTETDQWAIRGLAAKSEPCSLTRNLERQFEHVTEFLKRSDMPHNVALERGNPFVWLITYFGRPMTNLDGGLLRIRLLLSTHFPEEQPRVRFQTKIFHQHIAEDGTLCYTLSTFKREDIKAHIEAIIAVLEDDDPKYDPRKIVNLEASRLYWGTDAETRKTYNRRLRRSVREASE